MPATTLEDIKTELRTLYERSSKHGQYQALPAPLAEKLGFQFKINEEWRGDRTRYPAIREYVEKNRIRSILDVGANTGFFSLSLNNDLPYLEVTACELNKVHARIITILSELGGYQVKVTDTPADLQHLGQFGYFDCVLHLNILHHAGHDFDAALVPDRDAFSEYATKYLERLKGMAGRVVFQMGYNWRGDKTLPLVPKDDQAGKVDLTRTLFQNAGWEIEHIAFARKGDDDLPITYDLFELKDLPQGSDELQKWAQDRYGEAVWSEFYLRPIWFCKRPDL